MKRRHLIILTIWLCTGQLHAQQLPNWSTFYENGFIWNPALTAQWYSLEVSASHRQEWTGFDGAPQYSTLGFQVPISDAFFRTRASIGGFLDRDRVGPYNIYGIAGTYSYKLIPQLFGKKKDMLSLGIMAEAKRFSVDQDRIILYDNRGIDLSAPSGFQPNLSIGFFYRSNGYLYKHENHFFFGASLNRLSPFSFGDAAFSKFTNDLYATFHGGFRTFNVNQFYIEPNLMVVYGYQDALDVMLSVRGEAFEKVWFGTGISTTGEVFGQMGYVFDGRSVLGSLVGDGALRVGIKADYHLGSLRNYAGIGYEIYMAYQYEIE